LNTLSDQGVSSCRYPFAALRRVHA